MLSRILIRDFRNLQDIQLNLNHKITFFNGLNNQGKTSVLEALYILLAGKFLKERDIAGLVSFKASKCVIAGLWEYDDLRKQVYMTLDAASGISCVVDHKPYKKRSVFKQNCMIDYLSSDINQQFQASPSLRRQYLDAFCTQYKPSYAGILKRYQQLCRQKNMLLKPLFNRSIDVQQLGDLNQQLAQHAADLVLLRLGSLREIEAFFSEQQHPIFKQRFPNLKIKYHVTRLKTGFNPDCFSKHDYCKALLLQYEQDREKEKLLGYALTGPQRDDFAVYSEDKSIFRFDSKGVNRVLAILLKLVSWRLLSSKENKPLVLLLDDIFAELDGDVKALIASYVSGYYQLFIAGVDKRDEMLFDEVTTYQLIQGRCINERN
eukprot:COSAG01_NODE_9_length_43729_cov_66.133463_37_plen_376_part_00